MIILYDKDNTARFIRPCPLINITWNGKFNENGPDGGSYDIVLTGSLLDNNGSPIYSEADKGNPEIGVTWADVYNPKPGQQFVTDSGGLGAILAKQVAIRELFDNKCLKIEVCSIEGDEPAITFYPQVTSINFTEGIWVNKCDYTINMTTPFLLDKQNKIIGSDSYATELYGPGSAGWSNVNTGSSTRRTLKEILDANGGIIEDFQESWSLEPEEGAGNTFDPYTAENIIRVYRLTRNISAKGKSLSQYECFATEAGFTGANLFKLKAHEQARGYVANYIGISGSALNHSDDYPSLRSSTLPPVSKFFGSGAFNLAAISYSGFNHSRVENIDITAGTYSLQDTWILSSGNAHENYSLSLSNSITDSRNKVSIEGTIKGLTSISASGTIFGGNGNHGGLNTPYENAINKYRQITNDGAFGIAAWVYKRAQNAAGGFKLNHVPLSVAIGTNEFTGEITYSIEYDDRPLNLAEGVTSESINITDTYPGDVFSIIPVIGRPTGPVLQYIGGRTEYQRSLSIEFIVAPPSGSTRDTILRKPSLIEPTKSSLINIIRSCHPGKEPGIRKYFCSPAQETWDPKEGRYSFNVTWTYELNY